VTAQKKRFPGITELALAGAVPALLISGVARTQSLSPATTTQTSQEKTTMTPQSKFYCKINALNPEERAKHKELTNKLIAFRKETVETDLGYEFQFDRSSVSLAELATWVAAEARCCPFFDFHIDLEREGSLLCLRLTGEKGIKEFIRTEFEVSAK
jgi:hypothetical protein